MTPQSPNSIRKSIVMNPKVPLRQRLKALREMNPSIRFLNRLLKDSSLPEELRAKALLLLAEKTHAVSPKQKAAVTAPIASPMTKPENMPEKKVEKDSGSELIVIDPKVWDALGGFKNPPFVRGPETDPEKRKP